MYFSMCDVLQCIWILNANTLQIRVILFRYMYSEDTVIHVWYVTTYFWIHVSRDRPSWHMYLFQVYSRVSAHFARVFAVYSHTLRESCVPRVLTEYQCVFSHVFISRVLRWKMLNCHIISKGQDTLYYKVSGVYWQRIGNVLAAMHPAVSRVTKYMYSRAYHRVLHICRRFHADSLEIRVLPCI